MSKKHSVYLFNSDNPLGHMFNLTHEQVMDKLQDGWKDSPESFHVEPKEVVLTQEDIDNANPQDLVKLVESMGFLVLTPEQLKAQANQMAAVALDIEKYSDEELIAEAERRGLKDSGSDVMSGTDLDALRSMFEADPDSLEKTDLVELGNTMFQLGLRENMKTDTLISKINAALVEA